jgi:hypothetical protein
MTSAMSQTSSPRTAQPANAKTVNAQLPNAQASNAATLILAETRAVRRLIEEAFLAPEPSQAPGSGSEADPVAAILDVQTAILRALEDVRGSLQALHLRLDRSTRPASGDAR